MRFPTIRVDPGCGYSSGGFSAHGTHHLTHAMGLALVRLENGKEKATALNRGLFFDRWAEG
jgi:hypothetical protein